MNKADQMSGDLPDSGPGATSSTRDEAPRSATTRRGFLGGTGKKAAFVIPVVWTLTPQKAMAGASIPSGQCSAGVQTGGLCETDADCCSGQCSLGTCQ